MKKGTQKQKSGRHERRIAELFTKEYYPDLNGEFRRTPSSGGWDKRVAPGDIQPFVYKDYKEPEMQLDKSFPFSVECKDWKDENVKHIFSGLYSKPSQIYEWLEQSMVDAQASGKIPIVVFKLYKTEDIVLLHNGDFSRMAEFFGKFPGIVYRVTGGTYPVVFILLERFFEWIDWTVLKGLHKLRKET